LAGICAGDIGDLFASGEALLACPDGFTYADQIDARLGGTDAPTVRERYGRSFARSFNAGVLSIGPENLGEETYSRLLDWLKPERWKEIGPGKFTDQMLLNVHFDGGFTPLAARFNYMIFLEAYQKLCEEVSFLDARLVHFAGSLKPWFEYDREVLARRAPQFMKFFDAWRELLDEARGPAGTEETARRYRRQQDWIREYNEEPIEPSGRLY
jgi:lipopolysaccharide biosynthesis glycosyltransferase